MKNYFCVANNPDGIEITPRSLSRVPQGKYWVPDCADYQTKFNLPRRLKAKEVFAGWSCFNCKFLKETTSPKQQLPTPKEPQKVPQPTETITRKTLPKQQPTEAITRQILPKRQPTETVTRQTLSSHVADILGISQDYADTIITRTFETIIQCLSRHEPVKLHDFGNFETRHRKGRKGRHPRTGKQVQISDGFTIRFRPSRKVKDTVADWPGK